MGNNCKVVLITGVSSDIGYALASFFAKRKDKLILTYYHSKEKVSVIKEKLVKEYLSHVDLAYLDLCDEQSIKKLFNDIKNKYGKIDILINNAALSMDNDILLKTKKEFMQVLETNVVGTFLMMKYFDEILDGWIINLGSTDGIDTGNIYSIDYNVSKAGIINLTKTFALFSQNKVICLCPNWVDTESTRMIDKNYLEEELKRIKQEKLIKPETIVNVMDKCIKDNIESGSIIRIEGEEDVRRIS